MNSPQKPGNFARIGLIALGSALLGIAVHADTLVLRDGQRVQGELVSMRDGVIEFEAQRGIFRTERIRVERDDVAAIELEESRSDRRRSQADGSGRPAGMRERDVSVN